MNTQGKGLIHQELITKILKTLRYPKKVVVVDIRGHQKGIGYQIRGNNTADKEAQEVALRSQATVKADVLKEKTNEEKNKYTLQKIQNIKTLGSEFKEGKRILPDGREILPKNSTMRIINQLHEKTHWGATALSDQFLKYSVCIGIYDLAKQATQGCLTCHKINKKALRQTSSGGRKIAYRSFGRIQVGFT